MACGANRREHEQMNKNVTRPIQPLDKPSARNAASCLRSYGYLVCAQRQSQPVQFCAQAANEVSAASQRMVGFLVNVASSTATYLFATWK